VRAELHQVVTFATDPFRGNPAFVLTVPEAPVPAVMMGACELLGADVIAVIAAGEGDEPSLEFFTSSGPHPGAGHATMAAAHVALARRGGEAAVRFRLPSGERRAARRVAGRIAVDWPPMPFEAVERRDELARALGRRPIESYIAPFGYVAIFTSADDVAGLSPDLTRVAAFDRAAVIATAREGDADVVIRVFAPNVGLPEDPVCGTAHRIIAPYWSQRLARPSLHSRHLSKRGGDLWCQVAGDTVTIAGDSITVVEGTLLLPA
jgi:predicted PhzF superfamily epimerase YddE/YHI9